MPLAEKNGLNGSATAGVAGKVVVITGASSGIGAEIARVLAAQGASVVLGARRQDKLDAVVAEITGAGGRAVAAVCNVTERGDLQALVQKALDSFDRVDVLVNNAGIMPLSPLSELRIDEWDATVDVNIKGVLYGIAAALPVFQQQGSGHFVTVSSVAGIRTLPNAAVYCGTKYAVNAITDCLRQEVSPTIRTTVVMPGAIESELAETVKHGPTAEAIAGLVSLAVPPRCIADAVSLAIGQPASVSVNEIVVRPTAQTL